jgi:hypothetical protein
MLGLRATADGDADPLLVAYVAVLHRRGGGDRRSGVMRSARARCARRVATRDRRGRSGFRSRRRRSSSDLAAGDLCRDLLDARGGRCMVGRACRDAAVLPPARTRALVARARRCRRKGPRLQKPRRSLSTSATSPPDRATLERDSVSPKKSGIPISKPRRERRAFAVMSGRFEPGAGHVTPASSQICERCVPYRAAARSGLSFAAISFTSLLVIASPKVEKSWITMRNAPWPPITFCR